MSSTKLQKRSPPRTYKKPTEFQIDLTRKEIHLVNLFGVLQASCMFMGISFFRLGKFSSIILLKIFTVPLRCESSLQFIPIILRFGLLILSWISWIFWVRSFLHFAFSLTIVSYLLYVIIHIFVCYIHRYIFLCIFCI